MRFAKRIIVFLFAVLLFAPLLFTACGAGGGNINESAESPGNAVSSGNSASRDASYTAEIAAEESAENAAARDAPYLSVLTSTEGGALPARPNTGSLSEKIIYSAEANIETTEFDAAIEKVYGMLDRYGAFIETSYVSGRGYAETYSGRASYRSASFTLRVPKENFTAATNGLSELGNLLSVNSKAVNISTQYTDTESRLNAYRTEEERLLSMLSAVTDVESMIAIESRLSDVRYETESLTSTLRDWQNQVDYSSVHLYINEVERLHEQPGRSYAQEIGDGFNASMRGIGAFFREAFKFLVIALPVLVLLAVVALAAFLIVKKARAPRVERKEREHERDGDGGNGSD
jgi:hypothetical protein